MNKPVYLKGAEVQQLFAECTEQSQVASMSYLAKGKWRTVPVTLSAQENKVLHVQINEARAAGMTSFQEDQPVGISFATDSAKSVFETSIVGITPPGENAAYGALSLAIPDRVEQVPRRTYTRASVPDSLHVKVFLWHRGYANESESVPQENCWQGELVDLSAGGLQVAVNASHASDFKRGQLLGLQFTPMSYQIPIGVEGEVRHLAEVPHKSQTYIGVEFVGLEATREGREKLRRIVGTVDTYIEEGGNPVEEPTQEPQAVV